MAPVYDALVAGDAGGVDEQIVEVAVFGPEADLGAGDGAVAGERRLPRVLHPGLVRHPRPPVEAPDAGAEQPLGRLVDEAGEGGVGEHDHALAVDDQHALGQRVEGRLHPFGDDLARDRFP